VLAGAVVGERPVRCDESDERRTTMCSRVKERELTCTCKVTCDVFVSDKDFLRTGYKMLQDLMCFAARKQ
jgi:hypothetical protein